jgi:hydroxymethylglutaryl-CoA reductase (NADPH)
MKKFALIPMRNIGPININSNEFIGEVTVPLATFESPLWPSVARGARISMAIAGGISVVIASEMMSRSVIVEASGAKSAVILQQEIYAQRDKIAEVISAQSRFAKLHDINIQVVANLLYIRISITSGDAAGHNMVTKAAEAVLTWILAKYDNIKYVAISGNYCIDKKASAVNGILGRGKYVIAEITINRQLCVDELRTTPERVVDLNIKKNLIGSTIAGSIRSANAHFANMLLAFYLATGQDAANIIEGSQGITHAQVNTDGDLYFSVTIPNMILGAIGNGKDHDFVLQNLEDLGCRQDGEVGMNSRRLAVICGATILCGELSLLAAQTNMNELMRTHVLMERSK